MHRKLDALQITIIDHLFEYYYIYGPIFEYFENEFTEMKLPGGKILLLLLVYCSHDRMQEKYMLLVNRQAILFEFEYINYAWSYQHNGFIIDNEGNVLTYNNPENWNFPDSDLRISEKQVAENIRKCTHSGIKIPVKNFRNTQIT